MGALLEQTLKGAADMAVVMRLFLLPTSYRPLTFFGLCSIGLVLLAFLSLGLGLILDSTILRLLELERLMWKRTARGDEPEPWQ